MRKKNKVKIIEESLWDRLPQYVKDENNSIINSKPKEMVEVVHGEWVRTGQSFFKADKFICYSCSVCGFDIEKTKYQYCPHCGAKMDLQ